MPNVDLSASFSPMADAEVRRNPMVLVVVMDPMAYLKWGAG